MSEQPGNTTAATTTTQTIPGTTAPAASQAEHMIPKTRFDEVNTERQRLAERLAQIEAEKKAETEKQLVEQSKYKELSETRGKELAAAQAEAAKVAGYEKTLTDVLAAQIAELPEDKRSLVPEELTTSQKLTWLAKNAAILKAPAAFGIGAGKQGGTEQKHFTLSDEEVTVAKAFGMTPEEYAKHK
jgi:hypothetical protein